jgi:hypothetical protein
MLDEQGRANKFVLGLDHDNDDGDKGGRGLVECCTNKSQPAPPYVQADATTGSSLTTALAGCSTLGIGCCAFMHPFSIFLPLILLPSKANQ